ncbi:MAG TPA: pyridoxal kinase, partial [Candidatus Limnocylindria bacterium]|nr:pyridoxal kinase [Candidatus Limnocylindria bacterium]
GIQERGVLARCDGVLSGYMGSADTGAAILDAVARVKAANRKARYCCDPVIGDVGRGVFVRPDIPEFMRDRAVLAADIVTPNQFELESLSGLTSRTIAETVRACGVIHEMGPSSVLVTSLHVEDTPTGMIDMFASGPDGQFRVRTPLLDISVNGAGDAVAALFFAHYLFSGSTAEALSRSASSIYGLLRRTANAKSREILLVDAQQEFIKPSRMYYAEPVA